MNAVSGENLTLDGVDAGMIHDTVEPLRGVTDEARFCRTTATCIWGVSDPEN
jgi:hypothetical protein